MPTRELLSLLLLPNAAGGTHFGLLLSTEELHICNGFLGASEKEISFDEDGDSDLIVAGKESTAITSITFGFRIVFCVFY